MFEQSDLPMANDKILFTPGPLTTSRTIKQAMLRDLGSRDMEFIGVVRDIRRRLVALGEASEEAYTTVLMQGSGTFGIESVVSSTIPPDGHMLVIVNGAYGRRIVQMANMLNIPTTALSYEENQLPDMDDLHHALRSDGSITHVAAVHCETTSGIMNPIAVIGGIASEHGKVFLVDAMSSFGAVPVNLAACHIDYLISSSNKCIEGVPGFSFVLARKEALLSTRGYARSLSLDVLAQWEGLEGNGQFRFTPPTHVMLAFHQALQELEAEGGVAGRAERYRANYETLVQGMRAMGFREYVAPEYQGYIITSFLYPTHPHFDFGAWYERLSARGQIIYPGKVSSADCFRIGNIGRIVPRDVQTLLAVIRETLDAMGVAL
jgi:2-aminoethylphosphonate-pyruvate transaminase